MTGREPIPGPMARAIDAQRTKRDKINRLEERLKQLTARDITQGTRSVMRGILDLLKDEL